MFANTNNQKQSSARMPNAPAKTSARVLKSSAKTSARKAPKAPAKRPSHRAPKAATAGRAANGQLKRAERGRDGKFRPGHSGNPAGRPKDRVISEVMRDLLQETAGWPVDIEGRTNAEVIAGLIVKWGAQGNLIVLARSWTEPKAGPSNTWTHQRIAQKAGLQISVARP
jgi:hypothetical protein